MGRLLLGSIRMSIIVENLTVSYRRRPAVHHVDITFEEHSMWAVFGPNGAGKSTFLKSLMGLQPIDTGSIRLDGLTRQNIAYLPQQSDIDRSQPMTVFDLAAMGLWYEIGFFRGINAVKNNAFTNLWNASGCGSLPAAKSPTSQTDNSSVSFLPECWFKTPNSYF